MAPPLLHRFSFVVTGPTAPPPREIDHLDGGCLLPETVLMGETVMIAMWAPTRTMMDARNRERERCRETRMEQEPLQELELQVPLALPLHLQTAMVYGRGPRPEQPTHPRFCSVLRCGVVRVPTWTWGGSRRLKP